MSLISRGIGRTHDGAGVYEIGENPTRFVCGWTTGSILRSGLQLFDTREAAELAWEISPQPMNLSAGFKYDRGFTDWRGIFESPSV